MSTARSVTTAGSVTTAWAGTVADYDDAAGYGEVLDDAGERWWFHCTAIADGSRTVPIGATVRFRLRPGHLGRFEAAEVHPV